MGYPNFQHHPDGLIFIRTDAGVYMDTIANFQTNLGQAYPCLLDGFIGRYYEPGINHYITTGDSATPQDLRWTDGDAYIAAYDTLMAAKAAREATVVATTTATETTTS